MTDRQAEEHLERERAVLHGAKHNGRALSREVTPNGEGITWDTPLAAMMAAESAGRGRAGEEAGEMASRLGALLADFGVEGEKMAEIEVFLEARVREMVAVEWERYQQEFAAWCFEAVSPIDVVRRLFAWAKQFAPQVLRDFTGKLLDFRALGVLLRESHATPAARVKALFGDEPADWKKSATARRNMQRAQQRNTCRRGGASVAGIWARDGAEG